MKLIPQNQMHRVPASLRLIVESLQKLDRHHLAKFLFQEVKLSDRWSQIPSNNEIPISKFHSGQSVTVLGLLNGCFATDNDFKIGVTKDNGVICDVGIVATRESQLFTE